MSLRKYISLDVTLEKHWTCGFCVTLCSIPPHQSVQSKSLERRLVAVMLPSTSGAYSSACNPLTSQGYRDESLFSSHPERSKGPVDKVVGIQLECGFVVKPMASMCKESPVLDP